jgi:hypothetical protein
MSFIGKTIDMQLEYPDSFANLVHPPLKYNQDCSVKDYCKVIVFHPLRTNPYMFCPIHEEPLIETNKWYDGSQSNLQPRILFDLSGNARLVSCAYKCNKCPNIWPAHNADLLTQIEGETPFLLVHKSGFTTCCLDYIFHSMGHGKSHILQN